MYQTEDISTRGSKASQAKSLEKILTEPQKMTKNYPLDYRVKVF